MPDIFISYSRKDSAHALALAEKLRLEGMEVWIDQHGLEAAAQWSKEIVEAVERCSAFVLLLSNESLLSKNVVRELSIASESDRRILPIEIEDITLPSAFKYQLAGIQRAQLSDFEGILRSLTKLGVERSESAAIAGDGSANRPKQDTRKSLMVLPFEDLSPGKDNDWFADGLAGELIDALGHIKSLRLVDRKTTMDFKGFRGKTLEIAEELKVRYFVEGTVRKFGDQIKISVSLLDVKEGDYLWQESHKGVFADIFEIQEAVADKVVAGLKLHLTKDEKENISDRGTENTEAYELNLQAESYLNLNTLQGHLHSIHLREQAIALDPRYANAYAGLANDCLQMYRSYAREAPLLDRAEQAIAEALRLKPDFVNAHSMKGILLIYRQRPEEAIASAKKAVELNTNARGPHFQLGFIYMELGMPREAAESYEQTLKIVPDDLNAHFNLTLQYHALGDLDHRRAAGLRALPYYEKYVHRHPDDQHKRTNYSILLFFAERFEETKQEMEAIFALPGLDGGTCYNCACTYLLMDDHARALELLEKAVDLGFANRELFLFDRVFEPLRATEAWKRILTKLDAAEQKEKAANV